MADEPRRPHDPHPDARAVDELPLAFSAFHSLNREKYVRYAERQLGSRADAEEAVDQAFEQLLKCWCDVLSARNVAAYAMGVVKNRIADHQRALGRRPRPYDYAAFETLAVRQAEDPIAALEEQLTLYRVIDQLPPGRKDVIKLLHCEGYTHAETADLLGLSVAGVRSAERYAKRQLRHLLAADDKDQTDD